MTFWLAPMNGKLKTIIENRSRESWSFNKTPELKVLTIILEITVDCWKINYSKNIRNSSNSTMFYCIQQQEAWRHHTWRSDSDDKIGVVASTPFYFRRHCETDVTLISSKNPRLVVQCKQKPTNKPILKPILNLSVRKYWWTFSKCIVKKLARLYMNRKMPVYKHLFNTKNNGR